MLFISCKYSHAQMWWVDRALPTAVNKLNGTKMQVVALTGYLSTDFWGPTGLALLHRLHCCLDAQLWLPQCVQVQLLSTV
jgi:hypothetical protein